MFTPLSETHCYIGVPKLPHDILIAKMKTEIERKNVEDPTVSNKQF
jgi:hypothetical protein